MAPGFTLLQLFGEPANGRSVSVSLSLFHYKCLSNKYMTSFRKENQFVRQAVATKVTRNPHSPSCRQSLLSTCNMTLETMSFIHLSCFKSLATVYSQQWHCVRGENKGAASWSQTPYSLTQSPLCARVKGLTPDLVPGNTNCSHRVRANGLGTNLWPTEPIIIENSTCLHHTHVPRTLNSSFKGKLHEQLPISCYLSTLLAVTEYPTI